MKTRSSTSGLMPPLATSASLPTMSLIGKPGGRTQTMWSWCSSWARTMCPSTPSSSLLHCLEQVAVCLLHNTSAFQHEDVLRCCVWAKTKGICPSHQECVPFAPRACAFHSKSMCLSHQELSHQERVPFTPRACALPCCLVHKSEVLLLAVLHKPRQLWRALFLM